MFLESQIDWMYSVPVIGGIHISSRIISLQSQWFSHLEKNSGFWTMFTPRNCKKYNKFCKCVYLNLKQTLYRAPVPVSVAI